MSGYPFGTSLVATLPPSHGPECTCDRDPLGVCQNPEHNLEGVLSDSTLDAILGDCLLALDDQRLYRVVFGYCLGCGLEEDMHGHELCGPCKRQEKESDEMFARFEGDV